MNTPHDHLLFLSSPASVAGIFSPIQSASSSRPASRSRDNPRKRRSKFIPVGLPMSLDHSNYDVGAASRPRKISRKPDPNAPKITHPCSECGKKFWSWKALFGHMRCHPERQWRGMNPPVNFQAQQPEVSDSFSGMGLRPGPALTEEDHEVAACLLMLANSRAAGEVTDHDHDHDHNAASMSNHESEKVPDPEITDDPGSHHLMGRFECSSCKKVFGSHQALGGHRASHKNVKGCFANAMMRDSNIECCRDITVSDCNNRKSEFREGSSPTRLMIESYTAADKKTCDIDLSLRLGL